MEKNILKAILKSKTVINSKNKFVLLNKFD